MSAGVPGPNNGVSWNDQFHHDLNYIDQLVMEHKIFQAIQYIMTSFFALMSNFNEDYLMGSQAKIEAVLSYLQDQRNKIEQYFDKYENDSSSGKKQDVNNAIDAANVIYNTLNGIANASPQSPYSITIDGKTYTFTNNCITRRKIEKKRDLKSRVLGAQISYSLVRPNAPLSYLF